MDSKNRSERAAQADSFAHACSSVFLKCKNLNLSDSGKKMGGLFMRPIIFREKNANRARYAFWDMCFYAGWFSSLSGSILRRLLLGRLLLNT